LARAANALPNHEERPQQSAMADAVADAITRRRHLIVQAGTGTGKSLAYLVPALALGTRAVVSTATKALQDQLAQRDLPHLSNTLGVRFRFAVLKGRSNYICLQRVREIHDRGEQLALSDAGDKGPSGAIGREVMRLVKWADEAARQSAKQLTAKLTKRPLPAGDRAELPWEPSEIAWAQVSTSWRECPGAAQCPAGGDCFAERARRRAAEADVVVVNTHLYATSLALQEAEILPPHDLVIFDEAHELEDIASGALGFELHPGRILALARMSRPAPAAAELEDAAALFGSALRPYEDQALPKPLEGDLLQSLVVLRERANELLDQLRKGGRAGAGGAGAGAAGAGAGSGPLGAAGASGPTGAAPVPGELPTERQRAQKAVSHLIEDVNAVLELGETDVGWVEGRPPALRVAPLDVGAELDKRLWQGEDAPTAVMTSATVPPRLAAKLGLAEGCFDEIDVGSPFAYQEQALLYCPLHLPDPRSPSFEAAMHEELLALIAAARGRTLALFTSWRAMEAAVEVARKRLPWRILAQSDLPKPKLLAEFTEDHGSCLFATMGFWQGVDIPGPSLSLVTIDRLPFSRPDDPLVKARREAAGPRAFELIDLPRAATLLAQGAGRLVRSREDRGVVAVLDPRLGRARYRWPLVRALPPMRRTRSRAEVEAFLKALPDGDAEAGRRRPEAPLASPAG